MNYDVKIEWDKAEPWDNKSKCKICENDAIYYFTESILYKKPNNIISGFYCEDHLYGNYVEVIIKLDKGNQYIKRVTQLNKKPKSGIIEAREVLLEKYFRSGPLYVLTSDKSKDIYYEKINNEIIKLIINSKNITIWIKKFDTPTNKPHSPIFEKELTFKYIIQQKDNKWKGQFMGKTRDNNWFRSVELQEFIHNKLTEQLYFDDIKDSLKPLK